MKSSLITSSSHAWRFFRAGGFDQVSLESGRDLLALESLDQKLWVTLSCPTSGVEFDSRTLEIIDTDNDGHIRVPEILTALSWVGARITDAELLIKGNEGVPLCSINSETEEGAHLLSSVKAVLFNLQKEGAERITVNDVLEYSQKLSLTEFNGDGVITIFSTKNEGIKSWITDIIACLGGEIDRNGQQGITREKVDQFASEVSAWLTWQNEANNDLIISLFGETRVSLLQSWIYVKTKIDDFFLRCRLAAFDSRAASILSGAEDDFKTLVKKNLSEADEEMAALPLSAVNTEQVLDLEYGLNPAWSNYISQINMQVIQPILGSVKRMSATDWDRVKNHLSIHEIWWNKKPFTSVEKLGVVRLTAWNEESAQDSLINLIERDLRVKPEVDNLNEVEKLTRICRDLYPLINNFVSFRDFYTKRDKAIFQAGTLYIDGRNCELCVHVPDMAKHAALASLSRIFLVYCECINGKEKMMIAAAVTNGDSDQLIVGRNGLFYDRNGRDWDATVVRIIDHPISIRQAFWAPYKRIGRIIGEQIEKIAAARSKAAEDKTASSVIQTGRIDETKPATPQPFDVGKFAGIFAAIGLAVGAIGTAIASIATGFFRLLWWQMPIVILVLILLISVPSMIIAWLKLRQRNLGPMLDANGWAVNARVKLNIPFGASLTGMARLPEGTNLLLTDPFADKDMPWKTYFALILVVILVILAWFWGWFKL